VQAAYIRLLGSRDIGPYTLAQATPGVDAILSATIEQQPDFDRPDALIQRIEAETMRFAQECMRMINP